MQLYTPSEIDRFQQDLPYLIEIQQWIKNFLIKTHPNLGRSGLVCPYVPHALKTNNMQLGVIRAQDLQLQEIEELVLNYKDIFLQKEPRNKDTELTQTILLIFPDIKLEDTARLIDSVQQKLKEFFVDSGLMLGEFHKRNYSPGLHNSNFYPLQSPIPILAIRFMVESDLPFLVNTENLELRIKYLKAYLRHFENKNHESQNINHARYALELAQEQLQNEKLFDFCCDRS
ncbi:hypothetical protein F7734_36490 [Scytonema sp. UIC 10036]|uniref:DUF6875 domain-containing protein n=1 Tax=Scytonema sp. UIC 10036 TaxID=2304196 RepID=UPI0012DA50FE|nr:hypothetical protein [Scytonema sp. UIC 10036]MUG97530.1 hypothetical protein [Scytonema sp. UIC 10036]